MPKTVRGTCRLCSSEGQLSFEHIPPQSAFNKSRVLSVSFEKALELGPDEPGRKDGRWQQRGSGMHSLCSQCNNDTGAWYVPAYASFAHQGVQYLPPHAERTAEPLRCRFTDIDTHRTIKQVLVLFASVAGPNFARAQNLAPYLLDEMSNDWPHKLRVFAYLTRGPKCRSAGLAAKVDFTTGATCLVSEFSFPPFGFVLTVESSAPSPGLTEVTGFAATPVGQSHSFVLEANLLPTHLMYPGDYRTQAEIRRQANAQEPGHS